MGELGIRLSWRNVARGALTAALGLMLWPLLAPRAEAGYRALGNATLGRLRYGEAAHVELVPARRRTIETFDEDASWSTSLELRIEGVAQHQRVRINPRRLAYLPLVVLLTIAIASPLSARSKARVLALGVPIVLCASLASVWVTAVWLFARVPGLVYTLSAAQAGVLHFVYESFVTSLGNRYVLALAVGLLLVWRFPRAEQPAGPRAPLPSLPRTRGKRSHPRDRRVRARP